MRGATTSPAGLPSCARARKPRGTRCRVLLFRGIVADGFFRNVKLPTNATAAENPDITLIRKLSASPLPRSASYACNKQGPCQRRFQSQAAPTRMFIDYGNFPFDEIL
mmetsp:Transcript_33545/g.88922  ORF Transcript_33545/g.88922 Transcript_33545/m.88922 type:complete len:108 (-) Transcript_33545:138-461(-)